MPERHNIVSPWGGWSSVKFLGMGTYGKVYLFKREEYGSTYYCAIKHISIPTYQDRIDNLFLDGAATDRVAAQEYCDRLLESFVSDININAALKGHKNFVSYDDHRIFPYADEPGYDIYIKMEYFTSLSNYLQQQPLALADLLRIGEDICTAMSSLEKRGLVYREINPEDIFVNRVGDFKLGDYGTKKPTKEPQGEVSLPDISFAAPELAKKGEADNRADIYSLGLVLYGLLNGNRAPFLPPFPVSVSHSSRFVAENMRLRGDKLPSPLCADEKLSAIILKACAFSADKRWKDAEQMKGKLAQYAQSLSEEEKQAIVLDISVKASEPTLVKQDIKEFQATPSVANIKPSPIADFSAPTASPDSYSYDEESSFKAKLNIPLPRLQDIRAYALRAKKALSIAALSCIAVVLIVMLMPYLQGGESPDEPSQALTQDEAPMDAPVTSSPVKFHDSTIEAATRDQLQIQSGPIYPEDLLNITELVIETGSVKLIIDLFDWPNLTALDLKNQPAFDFSMLSHLKNLEKLIVSGCHLTDASPIGNLTRLTHLDISNNYLTDIRFVKNFRRISYLNISKNNVEDLSPLADLPKLETLEAEDTWVTDWSHVEDVEVVIGRPEQPPIPQPEPEPEPTPPAAEPTPPKSEPAPPKAETAPPKAEPTPPKSEPTPPKAEPTPPKAEPTPPKTEPVPPAVEPVPPAVEPAPPAVEPTPPAVEPAPPQFVAVSYITGVPSTAKAGTTLTLTGAVSPANSTNKDIVWSIMDAGETGATISGNKLTAAAAGKVILSATIANGRSEGESFTKIFVIDVN
ncbi:MAG: protein kinase [Clostridiales bacterium]|nr:protein kinase [Clostridiales bacterium]